MAKNTKLFIYGRVIELKPKDKRTISSRGLRLETVEQRLKQGWSFKNATTLNNKYVTKRGEICYCRAFPKETLYIPLRIMRRIDLSRYQLTRNYEKGLSIEEILDDDFEYFIESNERNQYDLANEDYQRSKEAEQIRREREKRKRPWLYDGTPQCVKPSEWYKHLAQNDIFIKVVQ